jgi:hypothetical protein
VASALQRGRRASTFDSSRPARRVSLSPLSRRGTREDHFPNRGAHLVRPPVGPSVRPTLPKPRGRGRFLLGVDKGRPDSPPVRDRVLSRQTNKTMDPSMPGAVTPAESGVLHLRQDCTSFTSDAQPCAAGCLR